MKNQLSEIKWFVRAGWLIIIIFLLVYFCAAFLNQPSSDDFYLQWLLGKKSLNEAFNILSVHANSRYLALWLMLFLTGLQQSIALFYPLYSLILLLLAFFSTRLFYFSLFRHKNTKLHDFSFITLLSIAFLFYSSPAIGENWFWLSAGPVYIIPFFVSLLGFAFVLLSGDKKIYQLGALLAFSFAGLSSEIFLAVNLFILLGLKVVKRDLLSNKNLVLPLIAILVPACLLIGGAGFAHRTAMPETISKVASLGYNFKMMGIIAIKSILPVLSFMLIALISVMYYFSKKALINDFQVNIKNKTYLIIFVLLYIYFFQYIFTVKFGDPMPDRVLLPFLLSLLIVIVPFFYKSILRFIAKYEGLIKKLMFLFIILQLIFSVINLEQSNEYTGAYEIRAKYLRQNKNVNAQLRLQKLPSPGLLHSAEITADSSNYKNIHLKMAFGLKKSPEIAL